MSEKLSDRLERFEFSDELGNGDFSLIQEAAAFIRAVEDAPEGVFGIPVWGSACLLANERFLGKRVKLVEVE